MISLEYKETNTGGRRYSIESKVKAVRYALGTVRKRDVVAAELGISKITLANWVRDYRHGRFEFGNAMAVRRKEVRVLDVVTAEIKKTQTAIARLESKLSELRAKAKAVLEEEYKKQLEALG